MPRPTVRAQAAEERDVPPRPVRAVSSSGPVTLPPPERLGIGGDGPTPVAEVDWNAVHHRLRDLNSVGSQLQRVPEGGYRFTFWLPTAQPDRTRRVEAQAASEGEAVRLALAQADQEVRGR